MPKSIRRTLAAAALASLCFASSAEATGHIDVQAVDPGAGKPKQVIASGLINAPPAKVWRALTDYGAYNQFMPRVAESKLVSRKGNSAIATMKLSLPFPFSGTWYTNRYDENPGAMSLSWRSLNGSIKSTVGGWTLRPQGSGTFATYRVTTDLGAVLIPKVLQDEVTKRTVPEIFASVEKRAQAL